MVREREEGDAAVAGRESMKGQLEMGSLGCVGVFSTQIEGKIIRRCGVKVALVVYCPGAGGPEGTIRVVVCIWYHLC